MKNSFKNLLEGSKETIQLIYGVLLIVLIVASISFNSYYIINKYSEGMNESLYHQAYFTGKSIRVLLGDHVGNNEVLQEKIELLAAESTEIRDIKILKPVEGGYEAVASANKDDLGMKSNFYLYTMAWMQGHSDDSQGVATNNFTLQSQSTQEDIKMVERLSGGGYWFVVQPIFLENGEKVALLSITISTDLEDAATSGNLVASTMVTVITIFIVILFLSLTLRLWDYVVLYKKMQDIDRMKDEFISMASHELRTPVTGIKGFTSMMLEGTMGEINEKVREALVMVKSASERLATLIDDLLDVNRIEQGRVKLNMNMADITPVIADVVDSFKPQANENNLTLVLQVEDREYFAVYDVDKLKQVMINIVGNAIKYTKEGEIIVMIEDNDLGGVKVTVKDTGIGMASEEREELFNKFYRIKNDETKGITGTGLGLWITRSLIEMMGAKIGIDSIKGVGTQAMIDFPAPTHKK